MTKIAGLAGFGTIVTLSTYVGIMEANPRQARAIVDETMRNISIQTGLPVKDLVSITITQTHQESHTLHPILAIRSFFQSSKIKSQHR